MSKPHHGAAEVKDITF